MSREKQFAKNTIILAIGTFFPKLAVFFTLPILTAYLTKEEYGTYDLILTIVSLVLPAVTLQIQSAAFRFLIDARNNERDKKSIITNIYCFVMATSIISIAIMAFFFRKQEPILIVLICIYFLSYILTNTNSQVVRGLSKNIYYTIGACISAFGQILLICLLVIGAKAGLAGCIFALAIAEILSAIFLISKGGIGKYFDLKTFSIKKIKELLSYSWPMVTNNISAWILSSSDRLIITAFMGVSANATYAVAYKIPSVLNYASTTFNMAWQEGASVAAKDNDVAEYYSSMFEWLFDIVAGCMALILAATPILFKILIRGNYDDAYIQIPILSMGIFFHCLSSFWGGIYIAFKKTKSVGLTTAIAAISNLVIDFVAIHWLGLFAASISTLISYMAVCIYRLIDSGKLVKLRYNWKHIVVVCIALAVQCLIVAQRKILFDILNLIIGITMCIIINRRLLPIIKRKYMIKKFSNKIEY